MSEIARFKATLSPFLRGEWERGWIVIRDVRGLWREEVWSVCGFQQ